MWAIPITALGRPIGILVAAGLAIAAGLHLPLRVGWRELLVVGCTATIGLVFSLFFATAVMPLGTLLLELKMARSSPSRGADWRLRWPGCSGSVASLGEIGSRFLDAAEMCVGWDRRLTLNEMPPCVTRMVAGLTALLTTVGAGRPAAAQAIDLVVDAGRPFARRPR